MDYKYWLTEFYSLSEDFDVDVKSIQPYFFYLNGLSPHEAITYFKFT